MSDSDQSEHGGASMIKQSKKRKVTGRMRDVQKKLRIMSHEMGSDCLCQKKCFENIPKETREKILQQFNLLPSTDAQNAYLCGLITVLPVQRPSKKEVSKHFEASYNYRLRGLVNNCVKEFVVCRKAFIAVHGITKKKIEYLVKSLKLSGSAPEDQRGKHGNQCNKLSVEVKSAVREHINSFKGRTSHYSLNRTSKLYLPEELSVKKMFQMFSATHPDTKISYESYRSIFCQDFNIAFGYPRTDTCSQCDEFQAKLRGLEADKKGVKNEEDARRITNQIDKITNENKVHKIKADTFYNRKRTSKAQSKKYPQKEAICIDFGKNLPMPNIATNDVYYKRQLSMYVFNVHVLSTSQSIFYLYPETEGKKGSNDVCSMLHHFIYNFLNSAVTELEIFCDSCSGQNKNFTMFRFVHHVVNVEKRLESIKLTFPIRGHSYMECDKNMGLVNSKARVEVPKDWVEVFKEARHRPSKFDVVELDHTFFREWNAYLDNIYIKKSPFPSRPIRELEISRSPIVKFRASYNGAWEGAKIEKGRKSYLNDLQNNEFILPDFAYKDQLPISAEKYRDLQCLKIFCSMENLDYFTDLPHL